ncbi:MAG: glycosyltransferase family 39 protein [Bryobacteraceae bacterium]|jgi:hypothetical protein
MTNIGGSIGKTVSLRASAVLVSLVYCAGLVYYAQVRPIEADEGYYTSAARLVWEGRIPYRDFSYPQGILIPYIYGWVCAIQPHSVVAMRLLSAAFGGMAVLLWGICLLSVKRLPTPVTLATIALILLNPYWVSWNVVVKTFASANLLTSIAMIALYCALRSERRKWYFIAGLALGACASTRSLYAPLVPVVLLWLLRREWRTSAWPVPKALTFLAGATCGVLPMILSFSADPRAFLFNNFHYRPLLNPYVSIRYVIHGDLDTLLVLSQHAYLVVVALLAVIGGVSLWKLRRKLEAPYDHQDYEYFELAFLMLLAYMVTSWIPYPVYDQYFTSPLIPFLVAFLAEGFRVMWRFGAKTFVLLAVLAPILFFQGLRLEVQEYSQMPSMQLASYRRVAQVIEDNSSSTDVVLSIWPGYVFESGRRYFPGSENHFNYMVGYKLTPQERARYHVLSKEEVTNAIATRAVEMFVSAWSGYHLESTMTPDERQALRTALKTNYLSVGSIDHVEVYRRR